jgi:serine/threonine-protein kinase
VTEGQDIAMIHFSSILEITFPRSWTLFSHYINKSPEEREAFLQKTFLWEKRQLFLQCSLFYHCSGNETKADEYLHNALRVEA